VDAPPPDFDVLNFNTDDFVPSGRLDAWRSVLSRKLFNVTVDPIAERPLATNVSLRILSDVRVGTGRVAASVNRHERSNASKDNDDILMLVNLDSTFVLEHRDCETTLEPGDAALVDCAESGRFVRVSDGALAAVRFRRRLLDGVKDLSDLPGRKITGADGRLQLLLGYANMLCDRRTRLDTPALRSTVTQHLADLASLAIGATPDRLSIAQRRGAAAARMQAIKADLSEYLADGALDVHWIAARHGITARHIHRLFEKEGTTFSSFLLAERLTRAHGLLSNQVHNRSTIATIAFLCGFNDVPHFNRAFRQRFGLTPSDIRAMRNT
jgi:AraC-like DNA-binding protein